MLGAILFVHLIAHYHNYLSILKITFIIDEIRRGFDDERLMKKRLKTSVMKSRGSLAHIEFKNYHNIDSDENLLGIQAQSKRSSWASVASDGGKVSPDEQNLISLFYVFSD